MADFLRDVGVDPTWVGLATIGGVLSLLLLLVALLRWISSQLKKLREPLKRRKLRQAYELKNDFRVARGLRRAGAAPSVAYQWALRRAIQDTLTIPLSLAFILANMIALDFTGESSWINAAAAELYTIRLGLDVFATRRAWFKYINIANYAEHGLPSAPKREFKGLRRRFF